MQALLPALRKQLRLPRLEYVSIQNQGDWMIEVPADRRDIPPVSLWPQQHSVISTALARLASDQCPGQVGQCSQGCERGSAMCQISQVSLEIKHPAAIAHSLLLPVYSLKPRL